MARPGLHAYKNMYMCEATWDVEHSLAMVSLNIYNPMDMTKRHTIW